MPVPISNVTRRQVYAPSGAGGAGPYAFTFEILANTDIAVYKDDVLLTLTTHYTVTINANGTGSVTITATGLALAPVSPTQYAIVGNRTIARSSDFTTGGDFFANTLNDELDQQTIFAQQNSEGLQRALSAPQTDPTSINMVLPRANIRANKTLGFDANGNPAIADTIGTNRGNWASGTSYYVSDLVKDTTTGNIWQCAVAHVSTGSLPIGTNTDSAKWNVLFDFTSVPALNVTGTLDVDGTATFNGNAAVGGTLGVTGVATFTANPVLSAATVNRVAIVANGKVLDTSAALTFNAGDGSLGVGNNTTSDYWSNSNDVVVGSTTGYNGITILGSSTGAAILSFGYGAGTVVGNNSNRAKIWYEGATDTLRLSNGGSTLSANQFVIDASGNVGLSTTAPAYKLDVTGTVGISGAVALGSTLGVTSTATFSGNTVLGDADTDTITQAASYVTGTQLKSAKTATNTLSLAAYDVDGTAYTNLITLTASNTPTLALTSTGVGTINNMSIGATTASTGAFTTLSASGAVTLSGGTINGVAYLNGTNVLTTGSALVFNGTNFGVGTTNSTYPLAVKTSTAGSGIAVVADAAQPNYAGISFLQSDGATQWGNISVEQTDLRFYTGTTEGMRLTSTSLYTASTINVGIGTSSPTAKLTVVGDTTNYGVLTRNPSGYGAFNFSSNTITGQVWSFIAQDNGANSDLLLYGGASAGTKLTIDSSGNLGIGTTTPNKTGFTSPVLSITNGTSGIVELIGTQTADGTIGQVAFYNTSSSVRIAQILGVRSGANNSGAITFQTNNAGTLGEAARIDSSGNLGLGVTPSAWTNYTGSQVGALGGLNLGGSVDDSFVGSNVYYNVGYKFARPTTATYATMYRQTGGVHSWQTSTATGTAGNAISFTQAMTLNASGNLGIGTTSPVTRLEIKDTTNNTALTVTSSYEASLQLVNGGGSEVSVINAGGSNILSLRTANTERARIDSSGNLLVGAGITSSINGTFCPIQALNNTANQVAYFRNSNANPSGTIVNYSGASPNNTGNEFVYCSDSTAQRASFRSNGGVANYSANNVNLSDRREKTNFAPAKSYLDVICAIPVQTFNYIDQNMEDDGGLTLGVVAQDVQAVAPELVMESNWAKDGDEPKMRLSIYQTDLQYALMKCIQEQQALITQLTARITALEGA